MRPGRPGAQLHRAEALHLAGRAHGGQPRVRRQHDVFEVERRERHRLVVEGPRGATQLGDGRRDRGDPLPPLVGLVRGLGDERAVDRARLEERLEEGGDRAAVLGAGRAVARAHRDGLQHLAQPLAGALARDRPRRGRVGHGARIEVVVEPRRLVAEPRARESPSTKSTRCTSSRARAARTPSSRRSSCSGTPRRTSRSRRSGPRR